MTHYHFFVKVSVTSLINGEIDNIIITVFMNSIDNADLVNDPAFANVKTIVEAEGDETFALNLFAKGYYPEDINQQVETVNSNQYIAPYAIIP